MIYGHWPFYLTTSVWLVDALVSFVNLLPSTTLLIDDYYKRTLFMKLLQQTFIKQVLLFSHRRFEINLLLAKQSILFSKVQVKSV